MTFTSRLADFVLAPANESMTASEIMRLSLYDWAVCGIAGAQEPVSKAIRAVSDPIAKGAPVFGTTDQYSAATAALINGATSHALDYDDTHFGHIGHPSVAICPAVLACGAGQSDADQLWAALIGAEVSIRIGEWLGRAHYQIGFHQTATAGAFGATAGAGRLLGLTRVQLQAAFGIAATQAAGLKSQFGTMGKPYHAGLAARTGAEAARLALAGFDTRSEGLDGPQGFGPTHHGEANEQAFEGLGTAWRMEGVSHKFHACCHGLHAMLEALAQCNVDVDTIDSVEVTTHPRWLSVCNIDDPATGLETKFSYRHTAAMALRGLSTAALDSYTDAYSTDPALSRLRQRVRVLTDEAIPETASSVVISVKNGAPFEFHHDLNAPIQVDLRRDRLRDKGRALLGESRDAELWDITNANRAPDMEALRTFISKPL